MIQYRNGHGRLPTKYIFGASIEEMDINHGVCSCGFFTLWQLFADTGGRGNIDGGGGGGIAAGTSPNY